MAQELDMILDNGFFAFNNKEFEQAEECARNALTLDPVNPDGLYLLGLVAGELRAYEMAEKILYQAVTLYKDEKRFKTLLGFILEKENRLDEALSFYEEYKDDAVVLSQIGMIYLKKNKDDFALSAFEKALEIDENTLTAYIGKALYERKVLNDVKSLEILEKAMSKGLNAELLYQLAVSYRRLKNYPKALEYIEQALVLHQIDSFYNEQGIIYELTNDLEKAKSAYEQAISLNSYNADAFANLGNVYLKENNLFKAEDNYKKALALDDNFLLAHHNLADVLEKQGRRGEALEHYRSAVIIDPKHLITLYNLALILEKTGEYSEGAGLYFNVLTLLKDKTKEEQEKFKDLDFRISITLALLSEQGKKEKKQALDFASGWVKHFPENVIASYTLQALKGEKTSTHLAEQYAEKLYDAFAENYQEKMQELSAKAVEKILENIPQKSYKNIIDLGCGTGTLAEQLKQNFNSFTGVDISSEMLKIAKEKNIYTDLEKSDVLSFLKDKTNTADLILACELTPYIADMETFLKAVFDALEADGTFLFTIENAPDKEDVFLPTGRYTYNLKNVEKLLKQIGFKETKTELFDLRKEGFEDKNNPQAVFVKGTLFSVTK